MVLSSRRQYKLRGLILIHYYRMCFELLIYHLWKLVNYYPIIAFDQLMDIILDLILLYRRLLIDWTTHFDTCWEAPDIIE